MSRLAVCVVAFAGASVIGSDVKGSVAQAIGQVTATDRREQHTSATAYGAISGRVLASDGGEPIQMAQVRLTSLRLPSRITVTDFEGRFEFADLAAGIYKVSASKSGYLTVQYGQANQGELGGALQLDDGAILEHVDIRLSRGGVIVGRVVDQFGQPLADVAVAPLRPFFVQGQRRLQTAARVAITSDTGEFRLWGLSPGSYYVSAASPTSTAMRDAMNVRTAYSATYYPGTTEMAQASPIQVKSGRSEQILLPLSIVRAATVAGIALDVDGGPMQGGTLLLIRKGSGNLTFGLTESQLQNGGTFSISGITPGEYYLRAQPRRLPGANYTPGQLPGVSAGSISVNGEDISGLTLFPMKPVTIKGRVISNSADGKLPQPSTVRVTFRSPDMEMHIGVPPSPPVRLNDDYTFEVATLPGSFVASLAMAPEWTLKSVRYRGVDVTDSGLTVASGVDQDSLEIEITDSPAEVSGMVADNRGEPPFDVTVILFSQDRELWKHGARHVATVRPERDGRFKVRTLASGRYFAAVIEGSEPDIANPDFLETLVGRADSFSLNASESTHIALITSLVR